jgi:hypothetical protein
VALSLWGCGLNHKGIGVLSLVIAVGLLIVFIAGIGYAILYLQRKGYSSTGGAISILDPQLTQVTGKRALSVNIQNSGPGIVMALNFTIGTEQILDDLQSNQLQVGVERGFVFALNSTYVYSKTYTLTVTAIFVGGQTDSETATVVCK